jgi:hypothetical protein
VPLAGLVWWVGGYLFWILSGLRPLPVGPRIALPLAISLMSSLVLGALVGGVAAGLLALLAHRRLAVLATLAGVALALVVTLAGAVATVHGEAPDAMLGGDPLAVAGLCAVTVLVALVGWAVGSAASLGRPGLGIALAVLAGALPSWLGEVAQAIVTPASYELASAIGRIVAWVGAAGLVAALVVLGARPASRLAWWPVAVLAAWFVQPLLTASVYLDQVLRPGTGLPGTLPDALAATVQVFGLASLPASRQWVPWVVALGVAVVIAVLRARQSGPPDRAELTIGTWRPDTPTGAAG